MLFRSASIIYGPSTTIPGFEAILANDGQLFPLGQYNFEIMHTPGHTMESTCFLLKDEDKTPLAIFTGDTLFIGDVGRPDLAQHITNELTPVILASHLFDSLRNKIMTLPDEVIIYPGHGAGSACGKNLGPETSDTLGNQKRSNYALDPRLSKAEFTAALLDGLMPPPGYFPENVRLNINGYKPIEDIVRQGTRQLSLAEFQALQQKNKAIVLDTRDAKQFAKAHIPGSINIGINGSFAIWVGTVMEDINAALLLVVDEGKEIEVVTRLARVGYENCQGFLQGGITTWEKAGMALAQIPSITAQEWISKYNQIKEFENNPQVVDVRKTTEFAEGHWPNAINLPLDYIHQELNKLNQSAHYYVHCAGGYRSMVFASIAKAKGFNVTDIQGGYSAIVNALK